MSNALDNAPQWVQDQFREYCLGLGIEAVKIQDAHPLLDGDWMCNGYIVGGFGVGGPGTGGAVSFRAKRPAEPVKSEPPLLMPDALAVLATLPAFVGEELAAFCTAQRLSQVEVTKVGVYVVPQGTAYYIDAWGEYKVGGAWWKAQVAFRTDGSGDDLYTSDVQIMREGC